ncbi:MAG: hypothetical protein AAF739_16230 [Pseudomonadota bacterium]
MTHTQNPHDVKPFPDPGRKEKAAKVRDAATQLSTAADHPQHRANRVPVPPYIFNFTKGQQHTKQGLLADPADYDAFIEGTELHDPQAFACVPIYQGPYHTEDEDQLKNPDDPECGLGGVYRQWESPTAGHTYVLQGPDPFAITMPPAPLEGSNEFAAEMAEVYQMALSRDWPIASFMDESLVTGLTKVDGSDVSNNRKNQIRQGNTHVAAAAGRLGDMQWFQGIASDDTAVPEERERRRFGYAVRPDKGINPSTLFRGVGEDGWHTPFLSQFMVMGTAKRTNKCDPGAKLQDRASGQIDYGSQRISQEVRVAVPEKDYMTAWKDYIEVQNGLNKRLFVRDVRGEEFIPDAYRFMARLRDMATYVHDDQLYQAYLNAALLMLGEEFAFDPGIPYHDRTENPVEKSNREPFALFGGPHLLTLVTEVSSRALKAVRLQKFAVHRRLRPEAAGALFHMIYSGYRPDRQDNPEVVAFAATGNTPDAQARRKLGGTLAKYTFPQDPTVRGSDPTLEAILTDIRLHNAKQNGEDENDLDIAKWLLPMAFPEGSPMHPAYGAGHATVAGACVTLLKAFFAMSRFNPKTGLVEPVYLVKPTEGALVPDCGTNLDDTDIDLLSVAIPEGLTLEGELNKLMWNISNARNIAGVHYYTDYIESALLGEAITIGLLREQMLTYHEDEQVTMTVPLLVERTLPAALRNGSVIGKHQKVSAVVIRSDGTLEATGPTPGRSAA